MNLKPFLPTQAFMPLAAADYYHYCCYCWYYYYNVGVYIYIYIYIQKSGTIIIAFFLVLHLVRYH